MKVGFARVSTKEQDLNVQLSMMGLLMDGGAALAGIPTMGGI
ncbi:hypothetical protein [Pseudoalteromonas phenolica]|nr:hypothetical protein [Pseudoalteromonas phenolica]